VIATADRCVRCGYDLTGLDDDAACPECGLGVERSRTASTHLRDAPPAWLRGVAIGTALLPIAVLVSAAWPFVFDACVMPWSMLSSTLFRVFASTRVHVITWWTVPPTWFGLQFNAYALLFAPWIAACCLLAVGLWLITRPQRRDPRDATLRRSLRVLAFVPLAATVVPFVNERDGAGSRAIDLAATALLTLGCAPIPGLAFALLRRLALRTLDARLAEHAAIVGVGCAIALVVLPLSFAAANAIDGGWAGGSDAVVLALAAVTVASIFFAGWATLTSARCAVAFGRAARSARERWAAADRASIARHGAPATGRVRQHRQD
jgi:hypothetical protein